MKYIVTSLLAFLSFGLLFGNTGVYASDDLDWSEVMAEYEYNEGREELDVKIFLEDINTRPDDTYSIIVEINNKDYEKNMSYSSSQDELYASFSVDHIDEDDLDDYLDLDIIIRDEDNSRVFDEEIALDNNGNSDSTSTNSDDLDWDELETTYTYDSSSERLEISVELEGVNGTPRYKYTTYVESDNKDYTKNMSYSSSKDTLYSHLYIQNVDEDELDDYLDIEVKIKDNNNKMLYIEDIDLDNNDSSNSNTRINWSEIVASMSYETDEHRLNARLHINDILPSQSRDKYSMMLKIDGKTYHLNMLYSDTNKSFYTNKLISVFSASSVKSRYDFNIKIQDEDNHTVLNKTIEVKTNKNATSETASTSTNTSTHNTELSVMRQAEMIAYKYIYKVEERYRTKASRIKQLNYTISTLESLKYTYKNQPLVNGVIDVIQKRIRSYPSGSTYVPDRSNDRTPSRTTGGRSSESINGIKNARSSGSNTHINGYVGGYNY